jgi:hypothetical protein
MAEETNDIFGGFDLSNDNLIHFDERGEVIDAPKKEEQQEPTLGKIDIEETPSTKVGEVQPEPQLEVEEPSSEGAPSSPSEPLRLFASVLLEEGVIDAEDDRLEGLSGPSDLVDLIKDTIKKNEYADLNDQAKQMLEDYRNGVPSEVIRNYNNQKLQLERLQTSQILPDDADSDDIAAQKEQIRKTLIYNSFVASGINPERARKLTDRSVELGDDIEDASAALNDLKVINEKKMEEQRQLAESQKSEAQNKVKKIEKQIMDTEEILPGMKVPERKRKELFDQMTQPVKVTEQGPIYAIQELRAKDPVTFDLRLHYLASLGLFNENPDISVFGRTSNSKSVKKFTDSLENQRSSNFGGGGNRQQIFGSVDQDLLKSLDNLF